MKFDVVIMNPPYNPNAIWSKFVERSMSLLSSDGKMVAIHPATWRESSKYDKLAQKIKNGISELHIMDYEAFKENKVATKTDWYVWSKNYTGEQTVTYSNGISKTFNLRTQDRILRVSPDSIPARILKKITSDKDNGIIFDKGWNYIKHIDGGEYKQCGGVGNGTGWCDGNFVLTNEPTKHQFENKVVISYIGRPRAKYFNDNTGVGLGFYWLTSNDKITTLLNSTLLWKIGLAISDADYGMFKTHGTPLYAIPAWILKSLNFENLTAQTEEDLYKHYNLTEEEIRWIEQ